MLIVVRSVRLLMLMDGPTTAKFESVAVPMLMIPNTLAQYNLVYPYMP